MAEFIEVIGNILLIILSVLGAVLLSLLALVVLAIAIAISLNERKKRRQRQAELLREPERLKRKEKEADERRKEFVFGVLGVDFDTLDDAETQDEIVRIVNLHAVEVANACVAQDRARRKKEGNPTTYLNEEVKWAKVRWAETRKVALAVLPELAERLPHFSEFEPLKSYNAEHLLRKNKGLTQD